MNRGQRRAHWRARNRSGGVAVSDSAGLRGANPSVTLHVNELVLHGFPVTWRHAIGEATQQELRRLVTNHGLPVLHAQGDVHQVDGGSFQVSSGMRPNAIGGLIAKAVYGGRSNE